LARRGGIRRKNVRGPTAKSVQETVEARGGGRSEPTPERLWGLEGGGNVPRRCLAKKLTLLDTARSGAKMGGHPQRNG